MRQNAAQRIGSGALVFFLVFLLLFSFLVTPVKAAPAGDGDTEATLEITGERVGGKFTLSANDLSFFSLENAAPGDTWNGTIKLINKASGRLEVCVHSIVNNLVDDRALFNELDLKISFPEGKGTIYNGSYSGTDTPVTDYFPLKQGESRILNVEVSMPVTAGNEFQGTSMDSTWYFDARYTPPSTLLNYYVHYLDEEGNELLGTKVGTARRGEEITEYAEVIEGYTPDKEAKSIILSKKNNEITFIYSKKDASVIPPEESQTPDPPAKEDVQTGANLAQSNSALTTTIFILLLALLAAVVTMCRIQRTRKAIAERDSAVKEAFKRDE